MGGDHCSLTISENTQTGELRFEALKYQTGKTLTVTCSSQQFEEICREQGQESSAAQTSAAVCQLFREAGEFMEEEELDAFGEEDAGMQGSAQPLVDISCGTDDDGWRLRDQQAFDFGKEHCSLTISENTRNGELRFELLKYRTGETLSVGCSAHQFEEVCREQGGDSGVAQTHAAVCQLFHEAGEFLEEEKALDAFGEDGEDSEEPAKTSPAGISGADDDGWRLKVQQAFDLGKDYCSLTISENERDGTLSLKVLKSRTGETLTITCTDQQFEEVCREQGGEPGVAQTNEAVRQLFREAGTFMEEQELEAFGEDEDEPGMRVTKEKSFGKEDDGWRVKDQQAIDMGSEHCSLTISENIRTGDLRFEVLKYRTAETLSVGCTGQQFEEICREQGGVQGVDQTNAAVRQLLREAGEIIEEQQLDAFGEDDAEPVMPATQERILGNGDDGWRVKDQQAFDMGSEHCSLTISENVLNGDLRFEVLKYRTGETLTVACTSQHFEEVCQKQGQEPGVGQTSAAVRQLLIEAGKAEDEKLDAFGEDDEEPALMRRVMSIGNDDDDGWRVKAQQAFDLGEEHCSLTISENKRSGDLRFEILKYRTGETLTVGCTSQQFEEVCHEQGGEPGVDQTSAAVRQLFREAGEIIEEEKLDAFGEDDDEPEKKATVEKTFGKGDDGWRVKDQQAFDMGSEHCSLTISENLRNGDLRFEVLKYGTSDTLTVSCTSQQFDAVCQEQGLEPGVAQTSAAVRQLFREAGEFIETQGTEAGGDKDSAKGTSSQATNAGEPSGWRLKSRESFQLRARQCQLTTSEHPRTGDLRFEVVIGGTGGTLTATCTREQFEKCCREQGGKPGAAQTSAAVRHLFREAFDAIGGGGTSTRRKSC